jgi:hypothetical protein
MPIKNRPIITLQQAYRELRKAKKLGIRPRNAGDGQYAPLALHIERENCNGDANYTLYLKCGVFEQRQVFYFDVYETTNGFGLRERRLNWTSTNGLNNRDIGFIPFDKTKIKGKRERLKKRRRKRKEARRDLFKNVLDTAARILDNHTEWRMLPLVYQEYPERTRRVYEDAKHTLWLMRQGF